MTTSTPRRHREETATTVLDRLQARLRGAHEDGGFTLIEAVVSLTIFVIVAAAAMLALLTGIKSNNTTNDRIGAAQVAQQAIDQARALPPTAVLTLPPSASATRGSKIYSITRQISYLPAGATSCPTVAPVVTTAVSPQEIQVHVVVTGPGGNHRTVTMDAVIAC